MATDITGFFPFINSLVSKLFHVDSQSSELFIAKILVLIFSGLILQFLFVLFKKPKFLGHWKKFSWINLIAATIPMILAYAAITMLMIGVNIIGFHPEMQFQHVLAASLGIVWICMSLSYEWCAGQRVTEGEQLLDLGLPIELPDCIVFMALGVVTAFTIVTLIVLSMLTFTRIEGVEPLSMFNKVKNIIIILILIYCTVKAHKKYWGLAVTKLAVHAPLK